MVRNKGRDVDVYVGIDVFGRGCLGGGGYNIVEVRVIKSRIFIYGVILNEFFFIFTKKIEVWLYCNYYKLIGLFLMYMLCGELDGESKEGRGLDMICKIR